MLVIALALLAAAPDAAASTSAQRLLVLDVRGAGVAPSVASTITDVIGVECGRDGRFDVVTSKDLRAFLDKEAARTELGCDVDSASCLAELAGALGASLVAYGEVNRLGEVLVVTINLFDASTAHAIGRETFEARSEGELPGAVHDAMARLLRPDDVAFARTLVTTGVVVAGAGAVGAVLASLGAWSAYATETDRTSPGAAKAQALESHPWWTIGAAVGAGLAAAGAVVAGAGMAVSP